MKLTFSIYTFLIIYFALHKQWVFVAIVCAIIPLCVVVFNLHRKIKINSFKKRIEVAKINCKNNVSFEPFLNINKAPWYIIDLLPGVSSAQAKNIAGQIREARKIKDFDEFSKIISLDVVSLQIINRIVKF